MSTKSVRIVIQNLIKASGIERTKKGYRFDKAPVYGFRKRFNTILKLNNDVNSNITEKLMAHKRGLDGAYLKPTREQCFAEFVKAISELTIDPTEKQKVIIEKQQGEISELAIQREKIEELEKAIKGISGEVVRTCGDNETVKSFEEKFKPHVPKELRKAFHLKLRN